jgi:tyrosyl-tRNA synthetase
MISPFEFADLVRRGLVKQTTGDITEKLAKPVTFYVGFDPTADSLHVGHLVQITTMWRLAKLGHDPIVLIGDGTARIGDPSGKQSSRPMLTTEEIDQNALGIEAQIGRLLPDATFVRNSDWLGDAPMLDFLRDIGSCFSVNVMLRAECFKARLEEGLTFLELSYMLMQAYDFLHLNIKHGCVLQVGGDDQWSNILAGVDLIRRKRLGVPAWASRANEAFGMTLPLLVNADGTKMGKTEKGTVWLDPRRTSPYDFFQFWRNIPDDKVRECFKLLSTAVPTDEIEAMPLDEPAAINGAKKRLAHELTELAHGVDLANEVLKQAESVFEAGDTDALEATPVPDGSDILGALVACGLATSRTDARNLVLGRGVSVNDEVVVDPKFKIDSAVFGSGLVLRKGKKTFKRLEITRG